MSLFSFFKYCALAIGALFAFALLVFGVGLAQGLREQHQLTAKVPTEACKVLAKKGEQSLFFDTVKVPGGVVWKLSLNNDFAAGMYICLTEEFQRSLFPLSDTDRCEFMKAGDVWLSKPFPEDYSKPLRYNWGFSYSDVEDARVGFEEGISIIPPVRVGEVVQFKGGLKRSWAMFPIWPNSHPGDEASEYAVDISAELGEPIYSPIDGVVMKAVDKFPDMGCNVYGDDISNGVSILTDDGRYFIGLGHIKQGSAVVSVGDRVQAGQLVAQIGNSGASIDPHLHLVAQTLDRNSMRSLPLNFICDSERTEITLGDIAKCF